MTAHDPLPAKRLPEGGSMPSTAGIFDNALELLGITIG
jgi:hypothetical protein